MADGEAGFEVERDVLTADEVSGLRVAVEGLTTRSRAGARHLMSHPVVAALATDARLLALAQVFVLPENGPLRVLPGTHRQGVLCDREIQDLAARTRPHDCIVARGGVVIMRPLLVHASSKSAIRAPRRVLHIEYAASFHLESGLELAVA